VKMDRNVVATERYINDMIASAERACYETAIENGYTVDEAEECDDGSVGCWNCPFNNETK